MSSIFFTVSVSADDDRLVGAELDDLAELGQRSHLRLVHLLGALVQRFFAARGQHRRSLARKRRRSAPIVAGSRRAGECPCR